MLLKLGLLDAIIVLLPGFVWVLLSFRNGGAVHRVLPGSGSIAILAQVPLFALIIHAIWALIFFIQETLVNHGFGIRQIPFDPNIYKWVLSSQRTSIQSSGMISYGLFMVFIITMTPYLFNMTIGQLRKRYKISKSYCDKKRRGDEIWFDNLVRKSRPDERWLQAYVVTVQETKNGVLGYAGYVEQIGHEVDGNISFIVLGNVETFEFCKDGNVVSHMRNPKEPARTLCIQREDYTAVQFVAMSKEKPPTIPVLNRLEKQTGKESHPEWFLKLKNKLRK